LFPENQAVISFARRIEYICLGRRRRGSGPIRFSHNGTWDPIIIPDEFSKHHGLAKEKDKYRLNNKKPVPLSKATISLEEGHIQ